MRGKAILFLIVVLAAALRWGNLGGFPPAVNWDEVSHGYNAYSILKTGEDEWGKFLPIFNFRAFGDYPLTLNLYLTVPFVAIWGLSEFSIRLPHMILGVLTVVASFFVAWGLTRRMTISLLAAFLVAIGPWYVFPSHYVTQANLSVFFLASAMALFFNRQKSVWFLPLAIVSLILTLFAYHSTRIFSPLLLVLLLVIYRGEWQDLWRRKGVALVTLGLVVGFFSLAMMVLLDPEARARSQWVFLIDEGAVNRIVEMRQQSSLPPVAARLIYNRPIYFVEGFLTNYVNYFGPKFLFFSGGTNYQFSVPNFGLLYPANLVGFYVGLLVAGWWGWRRKKKEWLVVLRWLMLAPVPASITRESLAVTRATTMLPLPEILAAVGVVWIWRKLKGGRWKWLRLPVAVGYFLGLFLGMENYLKVLALDYPKEYDWSWQYGYKEVVGAMRESYDKYEKIFVTKKYGEPHEFLLFYWPWEPRAYREDKNLVRYYRDGWYWVDSFDKFYFVNDWEVGERVKCGEGESCMLVTSPGNYPKEAGWQKGKVINYLSGKAVFEILDKGEEK